MCSCAHTYIQTQSRTSTNTKKKHSSFIHSSKAIHYRKTNSCHNCHVSMESNYNNLLLCLLGRFKHLMYPLLILLSFPCPSVTIQYSIICPGLGLSLHFFFNDCS